MRRRVWMAVAVGVALGASALLGFGPAVRSRLAAAAGRYGAVVKVASATPEWQGVRLRGVDVTFAELPGVRVWLDDVLIGWDGGRPVAFSGGKVIAVGSVGELLASGERWRRAHLGHGGGGTGRELAVDGFELDWRQAPGATARHVHGSGVGLRRTAGRYQLSTERLEARIDSVTLAVSEGELTLLEQGGAYRLGEISTAGAQLEVSAGGAAVIGAAPTAAARDPVQMARSMYRRMVSSARAVVGLLASGAVVVVKGARARLHVGRELLNLGPGTFRMTRADEHLEVALEPDAELGRAAAHKRITFSLRVPIDAPPDSSRGSIVATLRGGPLDLALLGVREGDLGLRDVARTTLESDVRLVLPASGRSLSVAGRGKLHNLALRNRRLAAKRVEGVELAWQAELEAQLDGSSVEVHQGEIDLGDIRLELRGTLRRHGEATQLALRFELPLTGCASAFESLPEALVPQLAGTKMAGTMALKGHARFDTARLPKSYDVDWDAVNSCRIVQVPAAVDVSKLRQPFDKLVYTPEGQARHMQFGPGTEGWVPRANISHYMVGAVLTTEDGRFFRHGGFDKEAIINSIRENLQQRRFVRGASTISMQLAKNLYLPRTKTISRKLQEAVLTTYLEQALTKDEIMELYLNVIEYGPMVYGIGPAARHYFNTTPSGLSLGQALYLASILADPKIQHFGADGAVTPNYMAYLRKLMKIVHKIGRISDEELALGLRETVVFGSPEPRLAPPAEDDPYSGAGADGSVDPLEQPVDAGTAP